MTEFNHHHPTPLTPSSARALVAVMIRGTAAGSDLPVATATVAAELLDALSRTLLVDVLGATPIEARTVLDYLWAAR